MKPKLACADCAFPLLDHDAVLELIALLKVKAVDIGLFEGRSHIWPSRVLGKAEHNGRRLAKKLNGLGLRPADVFLQAALDFASMAANHPLARRRRKVRDLFLRTLDYAAACGSKHVTGLPGVRFKEEPARASFDRCCEELAWRCEQAAERGLVFSIEAHIGSLVPRPRSVLRLLKQTPGLTLTLDYTHFTKVGIPDGQIEPLVAYASHFHVRGARRGRLQTSLQENTIDYRRILLAMRSTGYRGYLGIEYVWIDWQHCNRVDNLSETILWRDFLLGQASPSDR